MTSSIHSEFDPPKHLSKEQIIDMARRYIKYWRIEAQSFESKWEFELTRKWNLAKETMSNKSEWQPIETAPKDGTYLLLNTRYSEIVIGWFGKDLNIENYNGWLYGDGDGYSTGYYYNPINPTHWMPLPSHPPKK